MTSEPWTSTTFPSKVETFLASSEIMLSDSILIGLSRSALSASADSDVNAHIAARPRAAAARALFPGRHIKDAFDLRLQHELLIVLVHDHPDPCQDRAPLGNRDRVIRARDPLFGEYVQEFRASAKLGSLRRCLTQEEHVAVQEGLLALAIDGAASGGRDEVAAVSGNFNEARIKRFARTIVGVMHHIWSRECVPELARTVESLNGEVFDDGIGIVPGGLCIPAETLQHGVLQPKGQQPEKRHQNERQQRRNARFHASSRAISRSSVSWARMISSQISRAAPLPPGARVTWWTRSRTSSGASGTLAAKPQRASTGRSNQSSPIYPVAADEVRNRPIKLSKAVLLFTAPCSTSVMPSSAARTSTARERRAERMATSTPLSLSILSPWPSRALNAFNSAPVSLKYRVPSVSTPSTSKIIRRSRRIRSRMSSRIK